MGQNIPSKLKPGLVRNINNAIQIFTGQYNSMILNNVNNILPSIGKMLFDSITILFKIDFPKNFT